MDISVFETINGKEYYLDYFDRVIEDNLTYKGKTKKVKQIIADIKDAETNEKVGELCWIFNYRYKEDIAEIEGRVNEAYRHKGIASAALNKAVEDTFGNDKINNLLGYKVKDIKGEVRNTNEYSLKAAKNAGFELEQVRDTVSILSNSLEKFEGIEEGSSQVA